MNDEIQFKIIKIQIFSSFLLTVGGVFFGIGGALWVTSQIVMSTENYSEFLGNFVDSLNNAGISFLILGMAGLILGIFLPIYLIDIIKQKSSRK